MFDDDGEAFNPFNVGPTNNGKFHDFVIPRTPTYPPPVFATWPPPKEHTNKSVSKGTLLAERQREVDLAAKAKKSEMGEMAFSRAIKEEMAAAKRDAAVEHERIYAGRGSNSKDGVISILPVRAHRSASGSSVDSRMSMESQMSRNNDSTTTLKSDNHMKPPVKWRRSARDVDMIDPELRRTESTRSRNADNVSRVSHRSQTQNGHQSKGKSQTSYRHRAGEESQGDNMDHGSHNSMRLRADNEDQPADNISRVSIRSKKGVQQDDNVSHVSIRSRKDDQQADNKSRISTMSMRVHKNADNVSHVSMRSRMDDPQADNKSRVSMMSTRDKDNVSHVSIRSRKEDQQADNVSHVSIRSRKDDTTPNTNKDADNVSHASARIKNDQQADTVSRISIRSRKEDPQMDNKSHVSIKSKKDNQEEDNVKSKSDENQDENKKKPKRSIAELTEEIRTELRSSMTTTKELHEKAAMLSDRLKAGNERKHNRFSSLIRQYTITEPLKRCREDRMSFWFKDAVLS